MTSLGPLGVIGKTLVRYYEGIGKGGVEYTVSLRKKGERTYGVCKTGPPTHNPRSSLLQEPSVAYFIGELGPVGPAELRKERL